MQQSRVHKSIQTMRKLNTNNAAVMDAQIMSSKEEYAFGMGQHRQRNEY
jgi:hypothetical protein